MEEKSNFVAFKRTGEEKTLLVMANYQKEAQKIQIAETIQKVVADNLRKVSDWGVNAPDQWKLAAGGNGWEILLKGYQFLVLEV